MAASRAFAAFGLFLSDEMEPQGRLEQGVGREHYALASRYFLGAEVDLDETYAWGWTELTRLSGLMAETAEAAGISRVSARRYLEHLANAGRAEVRLRYGEVGRPERRYRAGPSRR